MIIVNFCRTDYHAAIIYNMKQTISLKVTNSLSVGNFLTFRGNTSSN